MLHPLKVLTIVIVFIVLSSGVIGLGAQSPAATSAATSSAATASASGQRISKLAVLASDPKHANQTIFLMDPDGSNRSALTDDNNVYGIPLWSPDGTKLAATSTSSAIVQKPTSSFVSQTVIVVFQMGQPIQRTVVYEPAKDVKQDDTYIYSMAWSPDSTRLLFFTNQGLHVISLDGQQNQMVSLNGQDITGKNLYRLGWTADGKQIIVGFSDTDHKLHFITANLDGSGMQELTWEAARSRIAKNISPDGKYWFDPGEPYGTEELGTNAKHPFQGLQTGQYISTYSWSPDSTQVAFIAQIDKSLSALFEANADASNLHKVATGVLTLHADSSLSDISWGLIPAGLLPNTISTGATTAGATVAATPAGTASTSGPRIAKLAVLAADAKHTQPAIFIMDPDGKNPIALTNDKNSLDAIPAWSPDGTKLAFVSADTTKPGTPQSIVVLQLGATIKRTVVYPAPKDAKANAISLLAWSPDSTQVIFAVSGKGVVIVNADGSKTQPVNLTDIDPKTVIYATWSADGTQIQLVAGGSGYSANPDGSNVQKIPDSTVRIPNVSPDGKSRFVQSPPSFTDLDGNNARPVQGIDAGLQIIGFAWSPDSKQVVGLGYTSGTQTLYTIAADSATASKVDLASLTLVAMPNSVSWGSVPADLMPKAAPGPTMTPTRTPIPSRTPIPGRTPIPSKTPKPTSTPKS